MQGVNLLLVGANQDLQGKVTVQDALGNPLAGDTLIVPIKRDGSLWRIYYPVTATNGIATIATPGTPTGTFAVQVHSLSALDTTWGGFSPMPSVTK